uniref:Anaphase-promoting complex subunit 4 WD40 domain-containing protein n=1 Tax=Chaetoceros debilis TaxID=122233 RepID=A0A7S3VDE8_9STRA
MSSGNGSRKSPAMGGSKNELKRSAASASNSSMDNMNNNTNDMHGNHNNNHNNNSNNNNSSRAPSMKVTSDEINILVYRYLQEAGFIHSAFTFAYESMIGKTTAAKANIPPGALIAFLQKGLQYVGIEETLRLDGSDRTSKINANGGSSSNSSKQSNANLNANDANVSQEDSDFTLLCPNSIKSLVRKNPPIRLNVPPATAAAAIKARLESEAEAMKVMAVAEAQANANAKAGVHAHSQSQAGIGSNSNSNSRSQRQNGQLPTPQASQIQNPSFHNSHPQGHQQGHQQHQNQQQFHQQQQQQHMPQGGQQRQHQASASSSMGNANMNGYSHSSNSSNQSQSQSQAASDKAAAAAALASFNTVSVSQQQMQTPSSTSQRQSQQNQPASMEVDTSSTNNNRNGGNRGGGNKSIRYPPDANMNMNANVNANMNMDVNANMNTNMNSNAKAPTAAHGFKVDPKAEAMAAAVLAGQAAQSQQSHNQAQGQGQGQGQQMGMQHLNANVNANANVNPHANIQALTQQMDVIKTAAQQDNDIERGDMLTRASPDEVLELNKHTSEVFMCAWNPIFTDLLATGSGDASARIWQMGGKHAKAGSGICRLLPHGSNSTDKRNKDVTTLEWSSNGELLATGSYDGVARVWERTGSNVHTLRGHVGPIFSLKWNKRGNYLLSGSYDKTTIVWDISGDNGVIKQQFQFHSAPALDVDWKDDITFASCSTDKTVLICRVGSLDPLHTFTGHKDEVNAVKWDPTGTLLASCSDDSTAKVWDVSKGGPNPLHDFTSHKQEIYTVKWSPTGPGSKNSKKPPMLATASFDGSVRLWNVQTGACISILSRHRDSVYSVAFSPSGDYLASGSLAGQLYIWRVKDGRHIKSFKGKGDIFEVAWNKEESRIAACFSSNVVNVIDFKA